MVLAATVLVLDNSEWSRNGDYVPNRFQAQLDCADFLFHNRINDNPENTVGIIANSGDSPRVLVSLTSDFGTLIKDVKSLDIKGEANFDTGLLVAQLILKHRTNKKQKQKVVTFCASPLNIEKDVLLKLGKKLKKNNVGVDVIDMSNHAETKSKLEEFVSAVNSNMNSNYLTVEPGSQLVRDTLRSSGLYAGPGGSGFDGSQDFGMGLDPNTDEELAMALRMSLEEELARQRAAQSSQRSGNSDVTASLIGNESIPADQNNDMSVDELDEDEQLRRAIQLSLEPQQQEQESNPSAEKKSEE